jgi:hypothetical protein
MVVTRHGLPDSELPPPVRNASRNATAFTDGLRPPSRICQLCGSEYKSSRPGSYCGNKCRQAAFRARRHRPVLPATPPRSHSLDVFYECGGCGERLLNERRCESCRRFTRRLGFAVTCSACDEPILLADLLDQLR